MDSVRCAIIGAGFAGAATAYHLAKRGAGDILVLEQESQPGVHASGQNAAMIRQVVTDPSVAQLARRGAAHVRDPEPEFNGTIPCRQCGSLLLARGTAWEQLKQDAAAARRAGLSAELWPSEKAIARVKVLAGAGFAGAVWTPSDGVVEPEPLLHGYLSGAESRGARVRYDCRLLGSRQLPDRTLILETNQGPVQAAILVNAAGAWAGALGREAGAAAMPLRPCRRHLFYTGPLPWVDPGWPIVWDLSAGLYFRPESEGLLLCACDETDAPPGIPAADLAVEELLAEKVAKHMPQLPDLPIQRRWAGLRTLTPDGRFVIGWDARVERLFWVAGLGGHGVTCSYAVGELAAEMILAETRTAAGPFSPARFSPAD